ncbi:MAG: septal ring lytic transglycosylase RlpA family protein [Rhodospirillales bacterium]|nr:septal ring lytic transglycosylase RlpA family protein [Rhodospirillales bacterium]MDE2200985.1 septal ring lytic transglycosylase RlpA family protein [Rhodospirillales bacterium]MDE2574681.1 septal ring lytic transglycosylase RlpA family protein [Rhodospirillales bacterium]
MLACPAFAAEPVTAHPSHQAPIRKTSVHRRLPAHRATVHHAVSHHAVSAGHRAITHHAAVRHVVQHHPVQHHVAVVTHHFDSQAPIWSDSQSTSSSGRAANLHDTSVWRETGVASWYGGPRWQGHRTASGTRYNQNALTAAHATLPLGSKVKVTVAGSGRSVIVTINDRPGTRRRIIDLSRGAAEALGMLNRGVAVVTLSRL